MSSPEPVTHSYAMASTSTTRVYTPADSASHPAAPLPLREHEYEDDDADSPTHPHNSQQDDDDVALLSQDSKRHRRLSSLQFDFSSNLLLTASDEVGQVRTGRNVAEPISVVAGVALIVGMQVGSGIFSSPGVVAKETGSVLSALLLWAFAGGLSWAGQSRYARLNGCAVLTLCM